MTQKIGNNLNTLLSSYQIFYQNLRGYNWNIQGKKFFELHLKFEEYYNDVQLKIDEIAERILTLEMIPFHSFSDYIGHSLLKPKTNITDGEIAIMQIREQLTELIKLQKDIFKYADKETDIATSDLMTRYISEQEKTVWMLKSFLS